MSVPKFKKNLNYTPWYSRTIPTNQEEPIDIKFARKAAYAEGKYHGYILGALCGMIFTLLALWSF